eukprot:snap_masked-scaffold_1-processed-gene-25.29-mRNA-1 protein AED:1.00 eAED:1.00 QI:0/0/0/0/1/1/3/0/591
MCIFLKRKLLCVLTLSLLSVLEGRVGKNKEDLKFDKVKYYSLITDAGQNITNLSLVDKHRALDDTTGLNLELNFDSYDSDVPDVSCENLLPVNHLCSVDVDVIVDRITSAGREQTTGHLCSTYADVAYSCVITLTEDGLQGYQTTDVVNFQTLDFLIKTCDDQQDETCAYINDDDGEFFCEYIDIQGENERKKKMVSSEIHNLKVGFKNLRVISKRHTQRSLGNLELWDGCYAGSEDLNALHIGISIGSELFSSSLLESSVDRTVKWVEAIVTDTNVIYSQQLNVKLLVKHIEIVDYEAGGSKVWDNPGCVDTINEQLSNYASTVSPSQQAIWHVFDHCYKQPRSGVAYTNALCNMVYNKGITHISGYAKTWLTFAHEIGHNMGAQHSFEEGVGTTGGVMDYGAKLLDHEYQFNEKYRKEEICSGLERSRSVCPMQWTSLSDLENCGNGVIDVGEECECFLGITDCTCCSSCQLKEVNGKMAQCDPIHNPCCDSSCMFKDTTAQCENSDGAGYCRNGHCSFPICKSLGLDGFCGINPANPCKLKCELSGVCYDMEGWLANGEPVNEIRDGAFCRTDSLNAGSCVGGQCVLS